MKKFVPVIVSIVAAIVLMIGACVVWYNFGYSNGHDKGVDTVWSVIGDLDDGTEMYIHDSNGDYHHVTIVKED